MAAQRGPELSSPFRCPRWPGELSLLSSIQSQRPGTPAASWSQRHAGLAIVHVAAAPASHQSLLAEVLGGTESWPGTIPLGTKHKAYSGDGKEVCPTQGTFAKHISLGGGRYPGLLFQITS